MSDIRTDRRYSKDHEWAKLEVGQISVGITDYAQHELGDIVFAELPKAGARVEQGKALGSIEAVKTVAEIFSPVSGTIADVNTAVQDDASLVNKDCYGQGWLVRITPDQPAQFNSLLDSQAYKKLIAE